MAESSVLRYLLVVAFLSFIGRCCSLGTPWRLQDYRHCAYYKLKPIKQNASGVSWNEKKGTVWIITNDDRTLLHEYDLEGRFQRAVKALDFEDPEGIAHMYGDTFAISDEVEDAPISVVNLGNGVHQVSRNGPKVNIPHLFNKGRESIAYDRKRDRFYVCLEKDPMAMYEVFRDGKFKKMMDLNHLPVSDISDMFYVAEQDMFMILSQESRAIVKFDRKGGVHGRISVQANSDKSDPEGLTFSPDGRTMVVVSEPDEMDVYRLGGC